jgi:O-methyltransferase domain
MPGDLARSATEDYFTFFDDSYIALLPHVLRIAVEIGVCDAIAAGAMSAQDLSDVVGADADMLSRLLRALTSIGVLRELDRGRLGLTSIGERLASGADNSIRESLANRDSLQAWVGATEAVRSGRVAFNDIYEADFFGYRDSDPEANRSFMRRMHERAGQCYSQVITSINWESSKVILDIGGGDGHLLGQILQQAQHASGILFERPSAVTLIKERGQLSHLKDRCTLVAGDFFLGLPEGADTHLMCSILHDWPDSAAVNILRNSRRMLAQAGRLLVVEMIVPPGNGWHPSKFSDISMMILTGGKERTEDEFRTLFSSAGYELMSVQSLPGSYYSVLEAI